MKLILTTAGCAVVWIVVQNVRYRMTPKEYISMAKMVVGGGVRPPSKISSPAQALINTTIVLLECPEMQRFALPRVKALNPDLKLVPVRIRATQNKDSSGINVLAIGEEPKFTRAYLNAVLDEHRSFRDKLRESQRNVALLTWADDLMKREKAVKIAKASAKGFGLKPELAEAEAKRLLNHLMNLRNQQDARNQADLGLVPKSSDHPNGAEIDHQLAEAETSYAKAAQLSLDSKLLWDQHEREAQAWREMFDLIRRVNPYDGDVEVFAIMERATVCVSDVEPWWLISFKLPSPKSSR